MPPIPQGQQFGANAKPRQHAAAAPVVSYTPTETVIPPTLYHKVPNLELYQKLKEAEKDVDILISRKALDFQAIQQKTIHPLNFKGETGILRVFVYNTNENQPWQKQLQQEQGKQVADPHAESTWTLRVEGRFLSDSQDNSESEAFKFSSFLSGISIDIIPNDDYPALQNSLSNIIEWRNDTGDLSRNINSASFDGLDIKRSGIFNINTKIAILVKSHSARLKLSDEMSQFTGKHESTQQELIYMIWQYVLYKNLIRKTDNLTKVPAVSSSGLHDGTINQDADNEDLTVAQADSVLKSLLKVDTFKFTDLYKLLQPHFKPRAPILIDYEVNTRKSTTLGEVVLDIPIELPLNLSKVQKELLNFNKLAFDNLTKADGIIQKLNSRIALGIVSLQNANLREDFYRSLSDDPVKFIEQWLESQAETLKALKSDEGYDEEIVRRAQYFEENESLIRDKIDLLLGSNRF
ncbi:subunit of SWI/SNF transcription activation complex [Suhomyces tanzawaensis NRRL Y-17324]|uniref:Subunit of SWI/SNF transcription activation complex n=1 Tax=Suhomyces tanzawaensis NRRL Y-17324 TaxID=984487 RepID=A0A1E4SL14_9ASCO|nr:subunit of SWI/SNF transcription activation complex [Suhomyces tanzawaensis NRRL Y-17324]ODV80180.1 subunit of SWI/SNF transcription activation complex [Suhomyces tanzawaensis NRRL Y-17324]